MLWENGLLWQSDGASLSIGVKKPPAPKKTCTDFNRHIDSFQVLSPN
jgi:hypothetical protein